MKLHCACISAAAAAVAIGVAGCGGSSTSSKPASATTTPVPSAAAAATTKGSIAVTETEYKIAPANAKVVAAGGKVTFRIANRGHTVHALTLVKAGPGGKDVGSGDIQPGAAKSLTVKVKPGTYEWFCPVDGHKAAGMDGKFTVTS